MKLIYSIVFTVFLFILFSCGNKKVEKPAAVVVETPIVEEVVVEPTFEDSIQVENNVFIVDNHKDILPLFAIEDDSIHVINFWATWCGPCVKELPHFEEVYDHFNDKKSPVKFHYISLDFKKNYKKKLFKFLEPRPFMESNYLLIDPNSEKWIDAIDPTWTGAIPITIIYNKEKKEVHKGSINKRMLKKKISSFL